MSIIQPGQTVQSLQWDAPAADGAHLAAVSYTVKTGPASGSYSNAPVTVTTPSVIATALGLPMGTAQPVYWVVFSTNSNGDSADSTESSFLWGP